MHFQNPRSFHLLAIQDYIPIQQHFDSSLPYEEQIDGYIKRAGSEGPALMSGGERILRFTIWDQSGSDTDLTVTHDNSEEIKAYNAASADKSADLPK